MLSDVFQGLVAAIGQDHPEIAEALQNSITQGADALDDVDLSGTPLPAIMKAAVESGMLEGVTGADLSTAEGQLAAMIQLLGRGTSEAAEKAFGKLTLVKHTPIGPVEVEDPSTKIEGIAGRVQAASDDLGSAFSADQLAAAHKGRGAKRGSAAAVWHHDTKPAGNSGEHGCRGRC